MNEQARKIRNRIIAGVILIILITALIVYYRKRKVKAMSAEKNSILKELIRQGVKNNYLQAGILGVTEEETAGEPKSEYSYSNTSAKRLREIFGDEMKPYTDAQIDEIKKDDLKFYDIIYGGEFGNTAYEDGYKYRGRGYNGITFKGQYLSLGQRLGIDLVSNPDKLNEPDTASKALAIYMSDGVKNAVARGFIKSADEIKTIEKGTEIAMRINAGLGTVAKNNFNTPFIQTAYNKALEAAKKYV